MKLMSIQEQVLVILLLSCHCQSFHSFMLTSHAVSVEIMLGSIEFIFYKFTKKLSLGDFIYLKFKSLIA